MLADGTFENLQWIVDSGNYGVVAPCYLASANQAHKKVPRGTKTPSTFKLMFTPYYRYAACETILEGGNIMTGTYFRAIDTTKPLYLQMKRDSKDEEYYIYYLNVEVFPNL